MVVRLLAFASVSEILGREPRLLELAEGATLGELRELVLAQFPRLVPLWPRVAVAVDGQLIPADRQALTALRDGAEVALLPPVSGGSPHASLTEEPIDVASSLAAVSGPDCGAVVLFLGTVRNHHAGRPVTQLTYSAYRKMALSQLETIVRELEAGSPPMRVTITHRLGDVPAGEPSVVIAVASPHRQAAYEASRQALERLKKEVPIWKLEHYADGPPTWREEEPLGL